MLTKRRDKSQPRVKDVTIHKIYEINLPFSTDTKKKIQYENKSEEKSVFLFQSSHPSIMQITTDSLILEPSEKGKIALLFNPFSPNNPPFSQPISDPVSNHSQRKEMGIAAVLSGAVTRKSLIGAEEEEEEKKKVVKQMVVFIRRNGVAFENIMINVHYS